MFASESYLLRIWQIFQQSLPEFHKIKNTLFILAFIIFWCFFILFCHYVSHQILFRLECVITMFLFCQMLFRSKTWKSAFTIVYSIMSNVIQIKSRCSLHCVMLNANVHIKVMFTVLPLSSVKNCYSYQSTLLYL